MENLDSMTKLLASLVKKGAVIKNEHIVGLIRENIKLKSELNHLKGKIEGLLNKLEKESE